MQSAHCGKFNHITIVRVLKVWNIVCQDVCLDTVSSPNSFKCLVKRKYFSIVDSVYDVNLSSTWSLFRDCSCHRA